MRFTHGFSSEFGLKAEAAGKYKGHASKDILNVDGLQITKCSLSGKVGEERTEGGGVGAEADPDTALTGVHLMKGAFHLKFYRSMRFGVRL